MQAYQPQKQIRTHMHAGSPAFPCPTLRVFAVIFFNQTEWHFQIFSVILFHKHQLCKNIIMGLYINAATVLYDSILWCSAGRWVQCSPHLQTQGRDRVKMGFFCPCIHSGKNSVKWNDGLSKTCAVPVISVAKRGYSQEPGLTVLLFIALWWLRASKLCQLLFLVDYNKGRDSSLLKAELVLQC